MLYAISLFLSNTDAEMYMYVKVQVDMKEKNLGFVLNMKVCVNHTPSYQFIRLHLAKTNVV